MPPVVYLFSLPDKTLNRQEVISGVAHGKDDNTVIHAFPFSPSVKSAGEQFPCYFIFTDSPVSEKDAAVHADKLITEKNAAGKSLLVFTKKNSNPQCRAFFKSTGEWVACEVNLIPEKSDLYSRSKGLLETDALTKKSVGIVGLGSGGSPIAIELAKAGIGSFTLIDFDRLELSNVARHVCGTDDLGRYKTLAVRDAILQVNPYAVITTLEADVVRERETCEAALSKTDLLICASDNDRSRFLINEIALKHKIPALFGRALTRAVGGDVLRVRPYDGPCYSCLYSQNVRAAGSDDEEISQERQAKKLLPGYTSEKELQAVIQVGLSSDIGPISNLMVKLALTELSRGTQSGISSLEEDFTSDFYIWANRRENIYSNWSKLEFNFNKPSILRWYGAKVARDSNCLVCG